MARPVNLKDEAERVLARMRGQVTYRSGNPCKFGHVERYASRGACVECMADQQRRRQRAMVQSEMKAERFANGEFYGKL